MTMKKPTSGDWTPLDTAFIGDAIVPVRRGERYPWDHPSVQAAPALFVSAALLPDEVDRAVAAHRNSWLDAAAASASRADGLTSSGIRVTVLRRST